MSYRSTLYSLYKRQRIVYLFNKESRPESGAVLPCQTVSLIMHVLSNALDSHTRARGRAKAWSGLTWLSPALILAFTFVWSVSKFVRN